MSGAAQAPERVQVSDAARREIEALLDPAEALVTAVETDMVLPSAFGTSWLVGTDRRVCVFTRNGTGPVIQADLPLRNIVSLQRREGLGGGLLEAHTAEGAVPLVRYTDARSEAVETAREALNALLPEPPAEDEEYGGEADERRRRKRAIPCPNCGTPMPRWMSVCPDCLDKRQLIFRLLQRARNYWKPIALTFGLAAFLRFCMVYPAELQRELVDHALKVNVRSPQVVSVHFQMLWKIIVILAVVRVAWSLASALQQYLLTWLGERVTNDLRIDIYTHLQKLGVSYYDQKETGWIMDRVTGIPPRSRRS
jgi:hypothetical protein